ncbi:hypothetical protein [Nostoc sp.]|uniref:hypothetical protein n=1 Tax=Nostoc sp. TaxID=1180 RepID=UPI002FF6ED82
MEPLTTAAIAVGTIIPTKALEKTTEKVTESNGTKKRYSPCSDWFLASRLRTHSGRLRLQ